MKQLIAIIASVAALTTFAADAPKSVASTTSAPATAPTKKETAKQADTKSVAPAAAAKTEAAKK